MTITVAIPCFNGEKFIEKTIESVLAQTQKPNQIIVIDDGSTDKSYSIISRYPVHVIRHNKNLGLAAARNTALYNTETDLILFVDADAYASPQLVETITKVFETGAYAGVGGRGVEQQIITIEDVWRSLHATQGHGKKFKDDCEYLYGLCMAYRVNILKEVGGFDPIYRTNAEDVDIGLKLTNKGYKLAYTPNAIVYHQRQDNLQTLRKAMYSWYYWGYISRFKNKRKPWKLFAGVIKRFLFYDLAKDLFKDNSKKLIKLDILVFYSRMQALYDAWVTTRDSKR